MIGFILTAWWQNISISHRVLEPGGFWMEISNQQLLVEFAVNKNRRSNRRIRKNAPIFLFAFDCIFSGTFTDYTSISWLDLAERLIAHHIYLTPNSLSPISNHRALSLGTLHYWLVFYFIIFCFCNNLRDLIIWIWNESQKSTGKAIWFLIHAQHVDMHFLQQPTNLNEPSHSW